MKIFNSLAELVGNTPLLKISNYCERKNIKANIFVKLEYFNPAGSAKDRIAKNIIETAEKNGELKAGSVIIEATSGNTGIGVAAMATAKGYRAIIVMPENMSDERKKLMRGFGAELVLTDKALGMKGATAKAEELKEQIPNAIIAGQFENSANPEAHYKTTGPEIWSDTDGTVDIFVAGIGTGGTISGVGKYLKEKNQNIKIIGAEPYESQLITKGEAGPHKIQGIGANFIPKTLNLNVVDEIIPVLSDEAISSARDLGLAEGTLVGISSGAALRAAEIIAAREENKGKNIVVLLADTGERYLSTELFA